MIRKFVFASVALVLSIFIFGQKNYTQLADEKFQLNKYYEAIELYKKAYTKVSNKVEKNRILYNIGLSYYKMGDTKNASQYLKRVIKAGYPEADAYYYYGECLRSLEKYEDAIVVFQEMKQKIS